VALLGDVAGVGKTQYLISPGTPPDGFSFSELNKYVAVFPLEVYEAATTVDVCLPEKLGQPGSLRSAARAGAAPSSTATANSAESAASPLKLPHFHPSSSCRIEELPWSCRGRG
jgi:hypothetical protein